MAETNVTINLSELIIWIFFFFFIELLFPMLLDPLGLTVELMGYEFDDLFELIVLIVMPGFLIYYLDELSPFAYFYGLFIYLFITSISLEFFIYTFIFDSFGFLMLLACFDELADNSDDIEGDFDPIDEGQNFFK